MTAFPPLTHVALVTRTRSFRLDPSAAPAWRPSVFVRRHAELRLELELGPA